MRTADWDVWVLAMLAGVLGQFFKVLLYSLTHRRLNLTALGQSAGLPSLHAVVGAALLVLLALRTGWRSAETGVAFLLVIIMVFDAVRVRGAAAAQRRALHDLVRGNPAMSDLHRRVASYLDPIAHAPSHVAVGLLVGSLFAVAFGAASR